MGLGRRAGIKTRDIMAARRHGVLGALYAAASEWSLVTLADKGTEIHLRL